MQSATQLCPSAKHNYLSLYPYISRIDSVIHGPQGNSWGLLHKLAVNSTQMCPSAIHNYFSLYPYISRVDSIIHGPHGLEVLLHPVLESFRNVVSPEKVLQILRLGVVISSPRVHPLDNGRYVSEHHRMHHR